MYLLQLNKNSVHKKRAIEYSIYGYLEYLVFLEFLVFLEYLEHLSSTKLKKSRIPERTGTFLI